MTSTFETRTRSLRYQLRSRGIYTEERTAISSPEILSEPPQTQDDSPNTIQETPNSQFRLFLSVTPCMPRKDSLKSVNRSPSPTLFSPTPASSPAHVPTYDSPQNQLLPLPISPTTSQTSACNNSPELFSPTLSITPCMPRTSSVRSINRSPTHSSNPVHVPTSDAPQNQPSPSPQNPTTSLTPSFSNSLELFSPTPTNSTSKDKWPSPPPLPQRSPRIRRRHNLRNYTSLVSTNRNSEASSSVGAPPPNTSTSE